MGSSDLAQAAVTGQAHHGPQLLGNIVHSLVRVGLSLQKAIDLPGDIARQHIAEALQHLDETIQEIRDQVFTARGPGSPPSEPNRER